MSQYDLIQNVVDATCSTVDSVNSPEQPNVQIIDGANRLAILQNPLFEKISEYFNRGESSLKNTYTDESGRLCLIKLKEVPGTASITFLSLWNGYGAGKMYDPTAPQQRRDKQHSVDARKEMLLSYIGGEDLGKFILQEKSNGQFWIIDGRQRSSLVNEFLTDKMTLNGVYAQNFWKWFFTDNFLLDSNPFEPKDRIKINKILKTFEKGATPTVKFSDLPTSIQTHIFYHLAIQVVVIRPEVYLLDGKNTKVDESQWNNVEIMDSITRKFIDINQFHKSMDKKDMIWTQLKSAVPFLTREFLLTKPTIGQRLGYKLVDKNENGISVLDDTNEVRKFMILLCRALLIFQGDLKWGASELEVTKLLIKQGKGDMNVESRKVWRQWVKIINDSLMSDTYYEDGKNMLLQIPEEFTKSNADILKLELFLVSLYLIEYLMSNGYGVKNGYFVVHNNPSNNPHTAGQPTRKLFKLLEKILIYLTVGKYANLNNPEDFEREDLPLIKYNLTKEYNSDEILPQLENFEDDDEIKLSELLMKIKDLNQHQKGLSADYEKNIKRLIKYAETKI
jgi:hypothetical protein